jgi:hypothetical protein
MTNHIPDVLALVGLIMLGVGVGMVNIPLALTTVGGLLILLAVYFAKAQGGANVPE